MLRATFDELLDAVERLSPDAQEEFAARLRQRLAERGRQRVLDDVREARAEFESGKARPASVDDLLREIRP